MESIGYFLKLIRWPNLVFIAMTQVLFYGFVFPFAYRTAGLAPSMVKLNPQIFAFLSTASIVIAAAGYIINDYFDINIDLVNKAHKVIVGKRIDRRAAILLHAFLSLAGLLLTAAAAYQLQNVYLFVFNCVTVLLLLLYSVTFKKKLLIGNVVISLLTAWVVLVLVVAEYRFSGQFRLAWQMLFKYAMLYGGFAFIITMIREVIKDMEDLPGDSKFGCTTMPVVWGVAVAKVFAAVWILVLASMVAVLMIYLLIPGHWLISLYGITLVVIPLLFALKKLYHAAIPADFHTLSALIKGTMLTGILSMVFFLNI